MRQTTLLKKLMLLVVVVLMGAGSAWADEASFVPSNFSGQGTSGTGSAISATVDGVTFACDKGYGTTQIRCYSGGKITISSSNTITAISFTLSGSYTGGLETSYSGLSTTSWEKTLSSQARITAITVTYTSSSSSAVATTTTIDYSGITNTDVYTDTEAGSLSASVMDKDSNPVSGASVTWSGNNDAVATIDESTGEVTLVSAGTVTFTASYAGVTDQYQASSDTYEMTVTSSAPYEQPTKIEITPNYTFWGKTAQFSGSTYGELSGSQDNVSLSWTRGNGSTYANTTAMRFYKDNTLTFTAPSGYEIKSIEIIVSGTYNDLAFSPDGFDSETTTWAGSSATVTMSRPSNASSYATINKFTITIGLPSTDPAITANDVDIAYDATSGSIAFTVTNAVDGGVMSASTDANWLTLGQETVSPISFTCTANDASTERTATVTLTYTYNTNETVTKDVTITQAAAPAPAVVYSTIPALFAAATGTETEVQVTFDNWVVSGVSTNGKNVFVTDNSGNGFVIYYNSNMSSTFSAGNILSGTAIPCTLKLYNGFAELVDLDASNLTITDGGTVTAANIDMANLAGVNTGALVSYEGLTCSVNNNKYYLSDGTTTLQVYNSLYAFDALEDGKTYNITGVYQQYNSTKEILPRSADDIEEVAAPAVEYTLTVTASENVEIFTFVGDSNNQGVEGATTLQVSNGTEVGLSVSATQGYDLKLLVDGTDVTSQLGDTGYYTFTMPNHDVTVSATAVAPEVPVNPAVAGVGAFVKVTSTADITSGNYLIVYEDDSLAFDGSLETLDAVGNGINVSIVDGKIPATTATVAATFTIQPSSGTIKSASGKYIGQTSDANGIASSAETEYTNTISIDEDGNAVILSSGGAYLRYNAASNQERFRYYKSSSYTGQKAIQLYKYDENATAEIAITVSDAGYATYCSEYVLDFSNVDGLTAYKATIANDQVTFTPATKVPAGEGVLLKGAANTYKVPAIASAEAIENDFVGVLKATEVSAPIFVLMNGNDGVGFYKTTQTFTVGAHTAYLPASAGGNGARSFIGFDFDNTATAIEGVADVKGHNGEVYNLQGQRVAKAQKGLYIINGKKMVIK